MDIEERFNINWIKATEQGPALIFWISEEEKVYYYVKDVDSFCAVLKAARDNSEKIKKEAREREIQDALKAYNAAKKRLDELGIGVDLRVRLVP